MEPLITPSARARENLKSYGVPLVIPRTELGPWAYGTKLIFGSPIPMLLACFIFTPFISALAAQVILGMIALCTGFYMFADWKSKKREFRWFQLGFDIPLIALFLYSIFSIFYYGPASRPYFLTEMLWIISIYFLAYALDLFPGLNRLYRVTLAAGGFFASLSLAIELMTRLSVSTGSDYSLFVEANSYLFSDKSLCFLLACMWPWFLAGLSLYGPSVPKRIRTTTLAVAVLTLTVLILKARFEVLAAVVLSSVVILFYARKWMGFIVLILFSVVLMRYHTALESSFLELSSDQRREQLKADLEDFSASPLTGIGVGEYRASRASQPFSSHNNFFQVLASSGALGLLLHLCLIFSTLTFNLRLWSDIPPTHAWHRILAMGLLGSQITFHTLGLFHWTWTNGQLMAFYAFLLGVMGYMGEAYGRGLVSDDHCL